MTTSQLIERFRQLSGYDLDPYIGLEASDGEVVGVLNEALVEIGVAAYLVEPVVGLTVSPGVGSYSLEGGAFSRRVLEPLSVSVNGRRLRRADGCSLGLWTVGELQEQFPDWTSDATGAVQRAVWMGDRLVLHPAPATAVSVTVEAVVLPFEMSVEEPDVEVDLPLRLHPVVAQKALFDTCLPHAQESLQFSRLQGQVQQAMGLAVEIGRRNRAARFGSPTNGSGLLPSLIDL